jgi:hypothetical protein
MRLDVVGHQEGSLRYLEVTGSYLPILRVGGLAS